MSVEMQDVEWDSDSMLKQLASEVVSSITLLLAGARILKSWSTEDVSLSPNRDEESAWIRKHSVFASSS
jgi:hypothetical protein